MWILKFPWRPQWPTLHQNRIEFVDWFCSFLEKGYAKVCYTMVWYAKCGMQWYFSTMLRICMICHVKMSILFIKIQWNGLLRAKGVVILDTGHHLTFPSDGHAYLRCTALSWPSLRRAWFQISSCGYMYRYFRSCNGPWRSSRLHFYSL